MTPAVDWSPLLPLLGGAGAAAALLLAVLTWRRRSATRAERLAALTALALFLTLDLIAFGAFTRLTDSGLGCPDWPGCYGEAGPWAAREAIHAAQQALPDGPVTWTKAWIEMIHRYLAMVVGALIMVLAGLAWLWRADLRPGAWCWAVLTLAWVVLQGLFGRYTVTWKLYPAIVTLHLLGAQGLLMLLMVQHERHLDRPLALPAGVAALAIGVLALLLGQIALGGWVSSNYAVLACQGFPTCNGAWWPEGDWAQGFTLRRALGQGAEGGYLPVQALVSIHLAHRLGALLLSVALLVLVRALWRQPGVPRGLPLRLLLLWALQVASGVGNVVLQWPLAGALLHSVGAALLVGQLCSLCVRSRRSAPQGAPVPSVPPFRASSAVGAP